MKRLCVFLWAFISLLALPAAAQVPGYVSTDGLVGWWPFNGNANDESGNGLNGVFNNGNYESSPFDSCASFNGSNLLVIPNSPDFNTNNFTFSIRVKLNSHLGHNEIQFGIPGSSLRFSVGWDPSIFYLFPMTCSGTYGVGQNYPSTTINTQTWYHMVFVNDGIFTNYYLDGVYMGQSDMTTPLDCWNSNMNLYLGGDIGGGAIEYFNGFMDELGFWNRALTPEEITALYTGEPVSPPAACTPLPANLQEGLVGYWPFCGNANDESGNGHDGTVNGATLTEDRFGNANSAYSFDGFNNEIRISHHPDLNLISDFTISSWYSTDFFPSTHNSHTIIAKRDDNLSCCSANIPYNLSVNYQQNATDFRKPIAVFANSGIVSYYQAPNPVDLNTWTNIVLRVKTDTCSIYINGVLFLQEPLQNSQRNPNTSDLLIGSVNRAFGDEYMNGSLDDIAIYNRALSQEEITALYTGEPVSPPAACTPLPSNLQEGLVGYWPFCGNANDESGNGNDGTVNGATLTEDRFGNANAAYGFDGVDDYIQTNFPGIAGNNSRSVSFWAKTSGINVQVSDNMNVLCYGSPGNGANFEVAINHSCEGLTLDINAGVNTFSTTTSDNSWKHYTLVYDNSLGNDFNAVKYYSNGQLLSVNCQQGELTPINSSTNNPTTLGAYWNHLIRFFNGSLDDIAIYNRALSQEEITALYTGEPVSPPAACTPLPANLQEGLVGYWPFCGNANDESGNGNDGTVNGATLTEDRFGAPNACYNFNGTNQNIEIINSGSLTMSELSISAWILPLGTNGCIISKNNPNNATEKGFRLSHQDFFEGQRGLSTQYGVGNCSTPSEAGFYGTSGIIPNGVWSHVTSTVTNSGLVRHYLNGVMIESNQSVPFIMCNNSTSTTRIGSYWTEDPDWFNGKIDDLAIYNRVLTPDEVQELYTLEVCTFTVYDTLTTYETIYDTLVTYETLYDTLYTYETVYDTLTTYETVLDTVTTYETFYDTLTTYETVFDTLVTYETLYDTLTTYETLYDTITTVEMLYDTVITYETLYDTLTTYETIVDTLYEYETITAYDTVTTFVTVTDTLLIDITFTGIEGQPSWLNTVTVFPNPASDHITIHYGNFALLAGYNSIITDASGATVYSSAVNSQQAYIDINAWGAAGVYYLTIYDASGAPVAVRHIVLE
jgi:hypothetical protein